MTPADLQAIIVQQGAMICAFQDQVEDLQMENQQLQQLAAQANSTRMELPEIFDGLADGFLRLYSSV